MDNNYEIENYCEIKKAKKHRKLFESLEGSTRDLSDIDLHYINDDLELVKWESLPNAEALREENYILEKNIGLAEEELEDILAISGIKSKKQTVFEINNLLKQINYLSENINLNIKKIDNLVKNLI